MVNKIATLRHKWVWLFAFLIWFMVSCSSDDDTTISTPSVSLEATPTTISTGQSVTLSWEITGSQPIDLLLTPDPGVELTSPLEVFPTETTTYTLTASNAAGSDSASVTVTVRDQTDNEPINIDAFRAESQEDDPLTVNFSWQISGTPPVACSLNVGDGSEVQTYANCLETTRATHTYEAAGEYQASLQVASSTETLAVTVTAAVSEPATVTVGGFVEEQSRNVIIIQTDEDAQRHNKIQSLTRFNTVVAALDAKYGVFTEEPALSGINAAVLGYLRQTPAEENDDQLEERETPRLFNFADEFVVAVSADGTVLATSPLIRTSNGNADDDQDDSASDDDTPVNDSTSLQFTLELPTEETVALLIAESDGQGGWICKSRLEYQTLEENRTVDAQQTLYRFSANEAGNEVPFNTGRFQLNELTANLASRTDVTSSNTMVDDLPSEDVQAAIVTPEDAPEFADGSYAFCNNPNVVQTNVQATIDWRSEAFNVFRLPPEANPELNQGEAAVYDFGVALLLEKITEEDAEGNPIERNRLIASAPIDPRGNVQFNVVRNALENLDATLFFTDVGYFDSDKRSFPLTPTYEFDASARARSLSIADLRNRDGRQRPQSINLGTVSGGLAYISGRTLVPVEDEDDESDENGENANQNEDDTQETETEAGATTVIVLEGERASFNIATADETGFYELFVPIDLQDDYLFVGQSADGNRFDLVRNTANERYRVDRSTVISEDIILQFTTNDLTISQPPTVDAGENQEVAVGQSITLTGTVDDPDTSPSISWILLSAPDGSNVNIGNARSENLTFTPDVPGTYSLRFQAIDGATPYIDDITVTVFNLGFVDPPESANLAESSLTTDDEGNVTSQGETLRMQRIGDPSSTLTVLLTLATSTVESSEVAFAANPVDDNGNAAPNKEVVQPSNNRYEITFPANAAEVTFDVYALDDGFDETPELFIIEIAEGDYTLGTDSKRASFTVLDAPACERNYIVNQASDFNAAADCTQLNGSVFISNTSDLSNLTGVERIAGDLFIGATRNEIEAATGIAGREGGGNPGLTNLIALSQLNEIGGQLVIRDNPDLASLAGLQNTTVAGQVTVENNPELNCQAVGVEFTVDNEGGNNTPCN